MPSPRFFEWVLIAVLVCQACVAFGRAAVLRGRGVNVFAKDHARTPAELALDLLLMLLFLGWGYALVAYLWPFPPALRPRLLDAPVLDDLFTRVAGAALAVGQLLLYSAAVFKMGHAWRMGVDRNAPGPLTTTGVFALSRNPIYLAVDALLIGSFLITGRLILGLLAAALIGLIHLTILREERFLAERFGQAYHSYRARTGRYLTRPGPRRSKSTR